MQARQIYGKDETLRASFLPGAPDEGSTVILYDSTGAELARFAAQSNGIVALQVSDPSDADNATEPLATFSVETSARLKGEIEGTLVEDRTLDHEREWAIAL